MRSLARVAPLLVGLALGFAPGSAGAHTGEDEEFSCPACEKTFVSYVQHSGTSFGRRLDFKEIGPIRSPWPIPRCTHCGFVLYEEEWTEAQKVRGKAFVESDAYVSVWRKHTPYFCLGLILEACEQWSVGDLAYVFLRATWELGVGDERYPAYAAKAAGTYARVEAPKADAEGEAAAKARTDYLVAQYLQVELHRRAGAFDAAKEVLARIRATDRSAAPAWFDDATAFQATLVEKRDAAPYEFGDLPAKDE